MVPIGGGMGDEKQRSPIPSVFMEKLFPLQIIFFDFSYFTFRQIHTFGENHLPNISSAYKDSIFCWSHKSFAISAMLYIWG